MGSSLLSRGLSGKTSLILQDVAATLFLDTSFLRTPCASGFCIMLLAFADKHSISRRNSLKLLSSADLWADVENINIIQMRAQATESMCEPLALPR